MNSFSELDQWLEMALIACLQRAPSLPSPSEPPSSQAEAEADEWIRAIVANFPQAHFPSARASIALIPRLRLARVFGPGAQSDFERLANIGDSSATEAGLLGFLLLNLWHDGMKQRWLSGEFPD